MRKWTVIILLSFYCLSQLCSVLLYHCRSAMHAYYAYRQDVRIKNNKAEKISVLMSLEEYHRSKKEKKEIEINNILYDISSVAIKGNKVQLLIVKDEEETDFFKMLDLFIINPTGKKNTPTSEEALMWNWLLKIYIPLSNFAELKLISQPLVASHLHNQGCISLFAIEPPAQPPEC